MTIDSLFSVAVGAILRLSATVDVAGVELGTLEVVLVILAVIVAIGLGLYSLLVLLFFLGSSR
jgi:hypothetical protein